MQKSARVLGQEYGLTAEEMNRVLVKLGFLVGTPGDYSLTEKGLQYAIEKDFHRGTGGYACYNRYYTTRTFDDSIKDVLNVSPEVVKEVRDDLIAERTARHAAQAVARAKADEEFLKRQAEKTATMKVAEQATLDTEEIIAKWKGVGKISLIIGGVLIVVYGTYQITPKVKAWLRERKDSVKTSDDEAA